ncbi:MAG: hypothetical protein AAF721_14860 [Myxococcota bacterium]
MIGTNLALVAACGGANPDPLAHSGSTGVIAAADGSSSRESTSTSDGSGGGFEDGFEGGFEGGLEDGSEDGGGQGEGGMCSLFGQDCAAGLKCVFHCEGLACAPECRPVGGEGVVGDACVANGLEAEIPDDCGPDTICFTGEAEPGDGVCVPFCQGSAAEPTCADPGRVCAQQTLCLQRCDPFLQACPEGMGCFDVDFGAFVCWDVADVPIADLDECPGNTLCMPGSFCAPAALLADCSGSRCCTPHCDLQAADPCPAVDAALSCVEYGSPERDHSDLGVCALR